jgi:hypothetical protein
VEKSGEVIFHNPMLATGIMTNRDLGSTATDPWDHSHDQAGVLLVRLYPDVVHLHAGKQDRQAPSNQNRDPVGETRQALIPRAARANISLVCDPMSATCACDRLPIIIPDVPDEAVFRHDMAVNSGSRRDDTGLTWGAVSSVIYSQERFAAGMVYTFWHRSPLG